MGYDKYKINLDEAGRTVVGIILTSDITRYGASVHVTHHGTHDLEGTVDMYGTAGGSNALGQLRVRGDFDDLRRVIVDGSICQCCVRRVETESAGGEVVGEGWIADHRDCCQLD